jgi:hypothetical protein
MASSVRGTDIIDGHLLTQGTGYGVILGLSVAFTLIIIGAVKIQKRYLSEDSETSEMFMVANRSVGTGLTCAAVFSSWMWINETVFACVQTYNFGVAATVWWGAGLSFQVALMAVIGVLCKIRVPHAHTSLEIIQKRYGTAGHILFTTLNLINSILSCCAMTLTGSQLVKGMTGMHLVAATILLPFGGTSPPSPSHDQRTKFPFSRYLHRRRRPQGHLPHRLHPHGHRPHPHDLLHALGPDPRRDRRCWRAVR